MVKSVPANISGFKGEANCSFSNITKGRTLAKTSNSLLNFNRPCSGLTFPLSHFGPPIQAKNTASAFLQAFNVFVGNGSPESSIAAPPIKYS